MIRPSYHLPCRLFLGSKRYQISCRPVVRPYHPTGGTMGAVLRAPLLPSPSDHSSIAFHEPPSLRRTSGFIVELFDVLHPAFQTTKVYGNGDSWTPANPRRRCHRHNVDDYDRMAAVISAITTEVEAPLREDPVTPCGPQHPRSDRTQRSGGALSSFSDKPGIRPASGPPPSAPAGFSRATPRLADTSGEILGHSDDSNSKRPLASTSARALAASCSGRRLG